MQQTTAPEYKITPGKITLRFNGENHYYFADFWEDTKGKKGIDDISLTYGIESPLFQYFENLFCDWLEYQRKDTIEMYESDEAIYSKKGAIRGSIEILDEYLTENNIRYIDLDKEGMKIEIECAWQ